MSKKPKDQTLTIDAKALRNAVKCLAPITDARRKPILANIHAAYRDGRLTLSATNLEQSLSIGIEEVSGTDALSFLLPTAAVSSILADWSAESIDLAVQPNAVVLSSDRSRFKLSTADTSEFPAITPNTGDVSFRISPTILATMIHRAVYATDESSRYALGGLLFDWDADKLSIVGTDGRRLVAQSTVISANATGAYVVPAESCKSLVRVLAGLHDDELDVIFTPNAVSIVHQSVIYHTLLLEGRYPDWRKAIPDESGEDFVATIVASTWLSGLRQAMAVSTNDTRGVVHAFSDGLDMSCVCADSGESRVRVECVTQPDTSSTTTLDGRYVSQFLSSIHAAASVDVRITERGVLLSSSGVRSVIMPMADK